MKICKSCIKAAMVKKLVMKKDSKIKKTGFSNTFFSKTRSHTISIDERHNNLNNPFDAIEIITSNVFDVHSSGTFYLYNDFPMLRPTKNFTQNDLGKIKYRRYKDLN